MLMSHAVAANVGWLPSESNRDLRIFNPALAPSKLESQLGVHEDTPAS
jgi:hypothetical protein